MITSIIFMIAAGQTPGLLIEKDAFAFTENNTRIDIPQNSVIPLCGNVVLSIDLSTMIVSVPDPCVGIFRNGFE